MYGKSCQAKSDPTPKPPTPPRRLKVQASPIGSIHRAPMIGFHQSTVPDGLRPKGPRMSADRLGERRPTIVSNRSETRKLALGSTFHWSTSAAKAPLEPPSPM